MKKELYPINGNCQAKNIVSETNITCNEQTYGENIYIGIAETTLKKAYSNHKRYFNLAAFENDTKLLKKNCKIKRRNSKTMKMPTF